jgi:hypothetical protein
MFSTPLNHPHTPTPITHTPPPPHLTRLLIPATHPSTPPPYIDPQECARWLETFKSYETKSATGIQEHVDADYSSRLAAALTSVRGVNKTDATSLGSQLGSLADILRASSEQMSACPGVGPTKVSADDPIMASSSAHCQSRQASTGSVIVGCQRMWCWPRLLQRHAPLAGGIPTWQTVSARAAMAVAMSPLSIAVPASGSHHH